MCLTPKHAEGPATVVLESGNNGLGLTRTSRTKLIEHTVPNNSEIEKSLVVMEFVGIDWGRTL